MRIHCDVVLPAVNVLSSALCLARADVICLARSATGGTVAGATAPWGYGGGASGARAIGTPKGIQFYILAYISQITNYGE